MRWRTVSTGSLFLAGWLGFAWLIARGAGWLVLRFGLPVSPGILFWASAGVFVVLAPVQYARVWRGYLFPLIAQRPGISLSRDVAGIRATDLPWIWQTRDGYRAGYEIRLQPREARDPTAATARILRVFLRARVVSVLAHEVPNAPNQYTVDPGIEANLARLMARENARLEGFTGRGQLRLVVVCAVDDPDDARGILEEQRGIEPFLLTDLGHGFFVDLLREPAEVVRARFGLPAVISNAGGRYLPILIEDYRPTHASEPGRIQHLAEHLDRPVAWQAQGYPVTKGEIARIKRVLAVESGFPRGLLPRAAKQAFGGAPERLEALEAEVRSATPPVLLKQIVWVRLAPEDRPEIVYRRAKDALFDLGYLVRALGSTAALNQVASLWPGLERFAADTTQGLGRTVGHDELLAELALLGNWRGHEAASMIAHDHDQTVNVDLFAGDNPNAMVIGPSGSGKSVFLAGLIAAHLSRSKENRAIIVDYGGSFTGLVESIGGRQIAYGNRLQISPIPRLPKDAETARELAKQALLLVRSYLCSQEITDTKVFQRVFLETLVQAPRGGLSHTIRWMTKRARRRAKTAPDHIETLAWQQLRDVWLEVASAVATSPVIGESQIDFRGERLTSFNLDGYANEDKEILIGLLTIVIQQQLFAVSQAGRVLIVFDEGHMFLLDERRRASPLAYMLDRLARVTRKYGASLIVATQSPRDLDVVPSLPQNAANHIIMRHSGGELAPYWRIQKPAILKAAREAPPVAEVGYSTLFIGTASGEADIELALQYRLTPDGAYLFTSRLGEKQVMDMALALTGLTDYLALSEVVHADGRFVPIGCSTFWERVSLHIQDRYQPVVPRIAELFGDMESCPLLSLFLSGRRQWEQTCASEQRLEAFAEGRHATV